MVTALLFVIGLALSISFLCSIMEAVLLSVSHSFVALMHRRDERAGAILTRLREHIDEPIAASAQLPDRLGSPSSLDGNRSRR
jgi:hypothetical protein